MLILIWCFGWGYLLMRCGRSSLCRLSWPDRLKRNILFIVWILRCQCWNFFINDCERSSFGWLGSKKLDSNLDYILAPTKHLENFITTCPLFLPGEILHNKGWYLCISDSSVMVSWPFNNNSLWFVSSTLHFILHWLFFTEENISSWLIVILLRKLKSQS